MTNVAVIYYSSTGTNHAIAEEVADGARATGAEVRVRKVAETAPDAAVDANPAWRAFVDATAAEPVPTHDDLVWADAIVFGTPTRYGNVAAQLQAFIDTTAGLWTQGLLADKVYAAFTSATTQHGGQESTLLSLYTMVYHFGGFIVTAGYSDPSAFAAGGNPYGVSVTADGPDAPGEDDRAHARFLGRRVAEVASRLVPASAEV
jgi:NAD(P)H dehydrogenase (quinone)